jgi:hypothetical protein
LTWPERTSRPLLITGVVSLPEVGADDFDASETTDDGDFRGLGDAETSGERLTTEADLGDAAAFFVSGSYGLNENGFEAETTVGGDCDDEDDDVADGALTASDTTSDGLFLCPCLSWLPLLPPPLLAFSCSSLLLPRSAPICEHVCASS